MCVGGGGGKRGEVRVSEFFFKESKLKRNILYVFGGWGRCLSVFFNKGSKSKNKTTASGAIYARSSVIFPHPMAFVRRRLMQ